MLDKALTESKLCRLVYHACHSGDVGTKGLMRPTLVILIREKPSFDYNMKQTTEMQSSSHVMMCCGNFYRLFNISCQIVQGKLVNQIKAWTIRYSCWYAGEKCSYEVRNISLKLNLKYENKE